MSISKAVLAAALILGGTAVVLPADSADAQVLDSLRNRQTRRPQSGRCRLEAPAGQAPYEISAAECQAIAAVLQPVQAQDWAAAQAAVPAAQAAASSADARYAVGQMQFLIGQGTSNIPLQRQGVDAMIASGRSQGNDLATLYRVQMDLANQAGDTAKAAEARARLLALSPNDPSTMVQLAHDRRQSDPAGSIRLYQQAIQAQEAAGQPVPEQWRQQIVAVAYAARMPETVRMARELAASTRNPTYWRDALLIYRELGRPDQSTELDVYRLMRASQGLTSEADYVGYAEAARRGALFGEIKAVLDEGLAANKITTANNTGYAREMLANANSRISADRASLTGERTTALAGNDAGRLMRIADAYYGYGQYGDAAELYRAALQKGGDANVLNTRLGAALALAGQRAEAEAAFRLVSGPRAELAAFWLAWLASRG